MLVSRSKPWARLFGVALSLVVVSVVACSDDDPTAPVVPGAFSIEVATNVDSVAVSWTAMTDVDSFKAEITTNPTLTKWVLGDATEAIFTSDDGVEDGADYTAVVTAVNQVGERVSSNSPTVTPDFFPWDEYFETALHHTRAGKSTWYSETPNEGFEIYTDVDYNTLPCQGCHRPDQTDDFDGCTGCHDEADPGLGSTVDASVTGVCGGCHGRMAAEMAYSTDVHRDDLGMTCMDCHTMEDVHGDGTTYASMLEDGAIDAKCENCHTSVAANAYHNLHEETVHCTACHVQTVVSCNNCHFETMVDLQQKKAYGKFHDFNFLLNYQGKVHSANYQSLNFGSDTWVAMAPFTAHTIDKNAITSCDDCHNSAAVVEYDNTGQIKVVTWDAGTSSLTHIQGIVPVPFDFQTSMIYDFVDLDSAGGAIWSFLETGPDSMQILYSTPLTQAQMDKLINY